MSKSRSPGRPDERVFVGLGGNVGDVADAMRRAFAALDAAPGTRVLAVSSLWSTPPWGKTDQPDFLNAVAELRTGLSPRGLLDLALATERAMKRERHDRWGPRTLDIDILLFGDRTITEEGLEIPHPRIGERAFVLIPLAEIATDIASRWPELALPDGMRWTDSGDWWKRPGTN
ncbi:MAG: 2-amino-4-hydroxy-6-hydroxymethyldihydropteridine diphosphokinase [Phyllobacteriaceae bacterium]|nr:2-amino-4-hydroxy-6-hydroxymethyldihydropteridine diphosphokinase [Phyllobacteriaceae bacterium]